MMDLVQCAALLNMEGASLIEKHDEQRALVSFNSALDFMSQAASSYYCNKLIQQVATAVGIPSTIQPSGIATLGHAPPQQPNTVVSQQQIAPIPIMAIPKPPEYPQMETDASVSFRPDDDSVDKNPQHFVYSQALVFNPVVARTPVDALFYSAVVIFNTALCFHLEGERKNDKAQMLKAVSLYDICLELLRESASRFNCSHVIISAMNNKACVYLGVGDYASANKILDQLLSVIVSAKRGSPSFGETDLNGILHNILLLKSSSVSAAA